MRKLKFKEVRPTCPQGIGRKTWKLCLATVFPLQYQDAEKSFKKRWILDKNFSKL